MTCGVQDFWLPVIAPFLSMTDTYRKTLNNFRFYYVCYRVKLRFIILRDFKDTIQLLKDDNPSSVTNLALSKDIKTSFLYFGVYWEMFRLRFRRDWWDLIFVAKEASLWLVSFKELQKFIKLSFYNLDYSTLQSQDQHFGAIC